MPPAAASAGRRPARPTRLPRADLRSAPRPDAGRPARPATTVPTPVRDAGCRIARYRSLPGRLAARTVEVAPAVSVADHGFQVLLPRHPVRNRILDDRAGNAAGHVGGTEYAVTEVRGQGQAAGDHGDRLGGGERGARRLDLGPAVLGDALAQLAEDRDHPPDLLGAGRRVRQPDRAAELGDPPGHDL